MLTILHLVDCLLFEDEGAGNLEDIIHEQNVSSSVATYILLRVYLTMQYQMRRQRWRGR